MGSQISSVFSSLRMAKLLVLTLFCVALAATAPTPDFELEDVEPRSMNVASPEEDGELDLDDEPRSDDSDLESEELDFDDEPRSMDVASPEEEGELDFDDEPRSDDAELESEGLDFDDAEPRSLDVASPEEEGELDFDDEPRSDMKDE